MNRKILWWLVSCLMALSLVVAACGPAATPTTTTPTTTTTTTQTTTPPPTQETTQTVVVPPPSVEQPKYGGTLTVSTTANPNPKGFNWGYEKLLFSDWTRGPAGTNQYDPIAGASSFEDNAAPGIAESWSMPTPGVWVLNIRQGAHWQQTPFPASTAMNGREVTAADVVWSFNWELGSLKSWIWVSQPAIAKASSINQTGPWQVTMLTPLDYLTSYVWLIGAGGGYAYVAPKEVTEKYNHQMIYQGDGWPFQEAVSTGPWITTEVVASSYTKQIRNTNYWMKDPVGPGKGNQLPYIDKIVTLTIPDRSTSLAALRTGKIDSLGGFTQEDWEKEMQQTPRYKWARSMSNTGGNRVIFMRMDKQEKPFKDIRVRQALMMATDFNAFKDQYYGGAAEIDVWPVNSNFKSNIYTPLNEMPQSVQDLYTYNPTKAKELLKAAGYPNGFKTAVVYASQQDGDDLSIFKDQWAKVGVELVLDVKDTSIYNSATASRNYEDMIYRFNYSNFPQDFYFTSRRGPSSNNISYYNGDYSDATIEAAFKKVNDAMIIDMPTVYKTLKELRPYIMESATVIPRPTPYTYSIWNPWLKNYYGSASNTYHWIDQNLKKSMGF